MQCRTQFSSVPLDQSIRDTTEAYNCNNNNITIISVQIGLNLALIGLWDSSLPLHETLQHIYGQREDDGWVLLCCDAVEGLQVPQLESRGCLSDHQRGFFQGPGGLHLSFGSDDLKHRQTILGSAFFFEGLKGTKRKLNEIFHRPISPSLWPPGWPLPLLPWLSAAAEATSRPWSPHVPP